MLSYRWPTFDMMKPSIIYFITLGFGRVIKNRVMKNREDLIRVQKVWCEKYGWGNHDRLD